MMNSDFAAYGLALAIAGSTFFALPHVQSAQLKATPALVAVGSHAVADGLAKSPIPEVKRAEPVKTDTLADYLLDAMLRWSPPTRHRFNGEAIDDVLVRYLAISAAVSEVARMPSEAPMKFALPDHPRSRTALFLLAQGAIESGFARFVQDQSCQSWAWREKHGRTICDGGIAFGFAQCHVDDQGGVVFTDDGRWIWANVNHDPEATVIHGRNLLGNLALEWRLVLRWARSTPGAWGSHNMARSQAAQYAAKHPFTTEMP